MHLNRTLLYAGAFLTALGAAFLLVDLTRPTTADLIGVLRLWPLALIAVGLAIALRRTQISLASGLLAAAVPGLVLGAAIAATPRVAADSGVWDKFRVAYERGHHYCSDVDVYVDFGNVHIDSIGGCP